MLLENQMKQDIHAEGIEPRPPLKSRISTLVQRNPLGYRLYLARQTGAYRPRGIPSISSKSGALKSRAVWEQAASEVEALGLPKHVDDPKNWDSLIALQQILRRQDRSERILDAGAEVYSVILPWLYLYGYHNLIGINLTFQTPDRRGRIQYEFGDITDTRFESASFGAITCLSVIEHGVNQEAYFREASRLLKPGGLLITSTDYYPERIDTRGKEAYGGPVVIFSRQDVEAMLEIAGRFGLHPVDTVDLDCQEKPVRWERLDLDYSFIAFTLQKRSA